MTGPRKHVHGTAHADAEAYVAFLMDHDGVTTQSGPDIANQLSISDARLAAARRHTVTCPDLAGYVIPYRRRNGALTLFEPSGTTIVQSLVDRSYPAMAGYDGQRTAAETIRLRQVAIVEVAAKEALSQGDPTLAAAFDSAALDIKTTGELHPMTVAQLRALGAVK